MRKGLVSPPFSVQLNCGGQVGALLSFREDHKESGGKRFRDNRGRRKCTTPIRRFTSFLFLSYPLFSLCKNLTIWFHIPGLSCYLIGYWIGDRGRGNITMYHLNWLSCVCLFWRGRGHPTSTKVLKPPAVSTVWTVLEALFWFQFHDRRTGHLCNQSKPNKE